MAALYLHNSLFAPERNPPPPTSDSTTNHNHNANTHYHHRSSSSATLLTDHTHTTEPLLHRNLSDETNTTFVSGRRQVLIPEDNLDTAFPGWGLGSGMSHDERSMTQRERVGHWEQSTRRRIRLQRATLIVLQIIMGVWLVYSTTRYFLVFTQLESKPAQDVALGLGTSSAVSTALLGCAVALSAFQRPLLVRAVPIRIIVLARLAILGLTSFFFLTPAIVSFALTFAWRGNKERELDFETRCGLDVDVVWGAATGSTVGCRPYSWSVWLGMAILRLGLTILLAGSVVGITIVYSRLRYPSLSGRGRDGSRPHGYHYQRSSQSLGQAHTKQQQQQERQSASAVSQKTHLRADAENAVRQRSPARQKSSSTISASSGPRHTLRSEPSSSGGNTSSTMTETEAEKKSVEESETRDLNSFVDRFRTLVAQISRETDDAVDWAQQQQQPQPAHHQQPQHTPSNSLSSRGSSSESSELDFGEQDAESLRAAYFHQQQQQMALRQEENMFRNPSMYPSTNYDYTPDDMVPNMYPPDEHIPMLNGFVRRMPTIESLGSYALSSVGGGAGNSSRAASRAGTLVSVTASTRPPTSMGFNPPSRGNSLHLSEMGYRLQQLGGGGGSGQGAPDDGTISTTTNDSSVATRSNTVSSYNTAASFASGTGTGTGSMPSPVESSSTSTHNHPPPPPLPSRGNSSTESQ